MAFDFSQIASIAGSSSQGGGGVYGGINKAIGAATQMSRGRLYGSDLARRFGPIEKKQTTAANIAAIARQQDFNLSLDRRKRLLTDISELRSPARVMQEARKLRGFTKESRSLLSQARAAEDPGSAILDVARLVRRGSAQRRQENFRRAQVGQEGKVADRIEQAQQAEMKEEQKRRKRQMIFGLFDRFLENRRAIAGAKAKKKAALIETATGFLSPS